MPALDGVSNAQGWENATEDLWNSFDQQNDQRLDVTLKRSFTYSDGSIIGQFPAGTPPGHIAKGILGRVQPVVLADGIGHAFGLYFAGAAVRAVGLFRVIRVDDMKFPL